MAHPSFVQEPMGGASRASQKVGLACRSLEANTTAFVLAGLPSAAASVSLAVMFDRRAGCRYGQPWRQPLRSCSRSWMVWLVLSPRCSAGRAKAPRGSAQRHRRGRKGAKEPSHNGLRLSRGSAEARRQDGAAASSWRVAGHTARRTGGGCMSRCGKEIGGAAGAAAAWPAESDWAALTGLGRAARMGAEWAPACRAVLAWPFGVWRNGPGTQEVCWGSGR